MIKKKKKKTIEFQKTEKESKTITSFLIDEVVMTESSDEARELYNHGRFGELDNNRVSLALHEALYLMEKGKLEIIDKGKKPITYEQFLKKVIKKKKNFWTRYCVYKNIRNRGYIIKTALKFGADFRVYDRGVKPGEDHAKWIVYPVHETSSLTWYEFSAKNRVAHSTKKRLLIAIVDAEGDCTFYEVAWKRP